MGTKQGSEGSGEQINLNEYTGREIEYIQAGSQDGNLSKGFQIKIKGMDGLFTLAYSMNDPVGSVMANILCTGFRVDIATTEEGALKQIRWVKTSFQEP
ncbi:hypothetical protein A167_03520 [Alcanivorax sp. S71-1-4]|uniref:hypothetical protein n=1 Tax=Alcanivorax sp. S71-1-4 TaxID=1177159 RepID=UPI00135A076A|nr:hypothetical protein [Alcanivorax sp. S71-1-4]KAF0805188.1 hypothetical protein A167_03520 [Alcanivorax sp. S71-1-4]